MMAQEIVSWCDACGDEPQRGHPVTLLVGDTGQRIIDLCDEHEEEILSGLRELIEKFGRSALNDPSPHQQGQLPLGQMRHLNLPRGRKDIARPFECFFCDIGWATLTSLANHYREVHGRIEVQGALDLYGPTCPVCGEGEFGALGNHGSRAHGAGNLGDLFRKAEDLGDPFGILRVRKAALRG